MNTVMKANTPKAKTHIKMSIAQSYNVPLPSKPSVPSQFFVNSKTGKKVEIIISQITKTIIQLNRGDFFIKLFILLII